MSGSPPMISSSFPRGVVGGDQKKKILEFVFFFCFSKQFSEKKRGGCKTLVDSYYLYVLFNQVEWAWAFPVLWRVHYCLILHLTCNICRLLSIYLLSQERPGGNNIYFGLVGKDARCKYLPPGTGNVVMMDRVIFVLKTRNLSLIQRFNVVSPLFNLCGRSSWTFCDSIGWYKVLILMHVAVNL